MEGFQVTEIGEKIYCILDAGNSSFYVVEGEEKAAVIDTGITAGAKILPVIRELTDKPLLLVITHAHPCITSMSSTKFTCATRKRKWTRRRS